MIKFFKVLFVKIEFVDKGIVVVFVFDEFGLGL